MPVHTRQIKLKTKYTNGLRRAFTKSIQYRWSLRTGEGSCSADDDPHGGDLDDDTPDHNAKRNREIDKQRL